MHKARFFLPVVVAIAAVVPVFVFADADADLDKAISAKSSADAKTALAAATSAGDLKAATTILRVALKLQMLDCHQPLVTAVAGIKAEDGVKKLADSVRHDPSADMRYLLIEGLALQGGNGEGAKAILDALDSDKSDQVLVIAARSARRLDPQLAVDRLIARLKKSEALPKESSLAREITGSLCSISGLDLTFSQEWEGWWKDHKDKFTGAAPAPAPAGGDEPANEPKRGKKKGSDGEGEGNSGGGDTVTGRLSRERPADARTIERLADDDVICIGGGSDKVQEVLAAVKIKHTFVKKEDFGKVKLDPKAVLIVNCDGKGHPLFSDEDIARIREFVEKGGYLFTSDWELKHTIERAFPGSIAFGGKSSETFPGPGYKVDIFPSREASGHPFLRDVFPLTTWDAGKMTWHMDEMSYLIKILSPDVKILLESAELKKRFPEYPAVAVTFAWDGKVAKPKAGTATGPGSDKAPAKHHAGGCVLHVLSHFKDQKDKNAGDHFALQQLLLNFFLEKQASKHAQ